MIQINATARLKVTAAGNLDEAQARKYLKALGIKLGRTDKDLQGRGSSGVTFYFSGETSDVIKNLTQQLKVKPDITKGPRSKEWSFDTKDYHRIKIREDQHGFHVTLIRLG